MISAPPSFKDLLVLLCFGVFSFFPTKHSICLLSHLFRIRYSFKTTVPPQVCTRRKTKLRTGQGSHGIRLWIRWGERLSLPRLLSVTAGAGDASHEPLLIPTISTCRNLPPTSTTKLVWENQAAFLAAKVCKLLNPIFELAGKRDTLQKTK